MLESFFIYIVGIWNSENRVEYQWVGNVPDRTPQNVYEEIYITLQNFFLHIWV